MHKKMNIGFDFDGIFIDTPPFVPKKVIEWLYRAHDHRLFYRIPSKPEQRVRNITHSSLFRPAITENIQEVRAMRAQNIHLYYLISSRFGFLKEKTEHLVKKYHLTGLFSAMHFNFNNQQPHVFKDAIIKKLKIDRYIDDDLPLLEFLAQKNQKTTFFWLNKEKREALKRNLFAVTSLSQMFEK